jgi:hypothetical protein
MSDLRDGFRNIVSGWTLIDDFDDLTDRIERAAEWTERNGPLTDDEEATVKLSSVGLSPWQSTCSFTQKTKARRRLRHAWTFRSG